MTDFHIVQGFEDLWRSSLRPVYGVARRQKTHPPSLDAAGLRSHLRRLIQRAPEVITTVKGGASRPDHLRTHLRYISRKGELALEDQDGCLIKGSEEQGELVADWAREAELSPIRRRNSPLSRHFVLSMPGGADPAVVKDAARACISEMLTDRFDYLFVLHTDTAQPHVHLVVRMLGLAGQRLYFWTPELNAWREAFAKALCDRGCEAAATPRYARGVAQKPERSALRILRQTFERGTRPIGRIERGRLLEAATEIVRGEPGETRWDEAVNRQRKAFRKLCLAQAQAMARSANLEDQALARDLVAYVEALPEPQTRHRRLVQTLRETMPAPQLAKPRGKERERAIR